MPDQLALADQRHDHGHTLILQPAQRGRIQVQPTHLDGAAAVLEVGQQRVVGCDVPAEQNILHRQGCGRRRRLCLGHFLFASQRPERAAGIRCCHHASDCRRSASGKRYGERYEVIVMDLLN